MSKKQSNNPFKMWESYVGVIVGLIYYLFFTTNGGGHAFLEPEEYTPWQLLIGETEGSVIGGYELLIAIPVVAIIGFLIGYGIHLLIRRVRK